MWALALFLFFVIAVAAFIGSRLIRLEYERYHDAWVDDGKPADYLTQLPGSHMARLVLVAWLFMTPDWMKSSSTARRLLLWYRIFCFIFFVGWILVAYLESKRL
ncbi:MAG TPA: hypothetical protein VJV03_10145 [Pyrinomonadaceae bacterium]|nr:hypothetical protein [Pyrinomonadaceae bacterium]